MANVFDVARYILEKDSPMSAMKLQKLCYYCQAWALVWDDEPLFPEEFEAWANGPVCPELFAATQGKFSIVPTDEPGDSAKLMDNQRDTIDRVLEHYAPHNAQWLSQLTHMEAPWQKARADVAAGTDCNRVISKESMSVYYGGL